MSKSKIGLLLVAVLLISIPTVSTNFSESPPVEETKEFNISSDEAALLLLKRWEGLLLRSEWDVNAYRIGWGTKSRPNERIDIEEANRRAYKEFCRVRNKLKIKYPNLDEWQTSIISVTLYNVGSFGQGMDKALKSGDSDRIAQYLVKYVHSNGEKLDGLVNRRYDETRLLLSQPENRYQIVKDLEFIVNQHIRKYD